MFKFTSAINGSELTVANIQQMYDDFTAHLTSKHVNDQFERDSIDYRHLKEIPRIVAEKNVTGTGIFVGALNKAGTWNTTLARFAHAQLVEKLSNGYLTDQPVFEIHCSYRSHDWETGSYSICIMYSTNSGSSFTMYPNTERYLGYTQAHALPLYTNKTTHYHTGIALNWWSQLMFAKREAHTLMCGVDNTTVDLTTVTHWCIGIQTGGTYAAGTKDVHQLDQARIWMTARDNG